MLHSFAQISGVYCSVFFAMFYPVLFLHSHSCFEPAIIRAQKCPVYFIGSCGSYLQRADDIALDLRAWWVIESELYSRSWLQIVQILGLNQSRAHDASSITSRERPCEDMELMMISNCSRVIAQISYRHAIAVNHGRPLLAERDASKFKKQGLALPSSLLTLKGFHFQLSNTLIHEQPRAVRHLTLPPRQHWAVKSLLRV